MYKFENLKVWQKSLDFVDLIYKLTNSFPKEEVFGLTSQFRRAAVSVSLNIAEGSGKTTNKEFRKFLHDSVGSLRESVTLLIIGKRHGLVSNNGFMEAYSMSEEISKMIYGLEVKLKS